MILFFRIHNCTRIMRQKLQVNAQKSFNGGKIKKKLTSNNVVVRDIFVKKIGPSEP